MTKSVPLSQNQSISKIYHFNSSASSSTTRSLFPLDEPILLPPTIHALVSINQIQIPLTTYTVNNSNDTLGIQYTLSGSLVNNNIKLPQGNPNATYIAEYLTTQTLSAVTFSYDILNLKMTASSKSAFSILSNTTSSSLLGFPPGQTASLQNDGSYFMNANSLINLTGPRSISLKCFSFKTENTSFSQGSTKNSGQLLAIIPITQSAGSVLTYIPPFKTSFHIIDKIITSFEFGLYDSATNEPIDLNGEEWSLVLELSFNELTFSTLGYNMDDVYNQTDVLESMKNLIEEQEEQEALTT